MKKIITTLAAGTLLPLALAACAPSQGSGVSTEGSTSMEKLIGSLGESFTNETGIAFTYNPTGSGSGIQAVKDGRTDIGLSSRSLKDEEKALGLKETLLAREAIAVVVNPNNPITDLSVEQIADIYTGNITNWSEIGGNNEEIVLIGREAGSGTRDGFESITQTEDQNKYRQELTSTGDVITAVSQNPAAIGYAAEASVNDSVHALSVDGVQPTEENTQNGTYVIQRPFVLVTKEGSALSENAQKFFDFATSENAYELILSSGAVPAHS